MAGNTVLVTGGAGYIGSHACKALAEQGYLPVTYDTLELGHDWAVKWGPLEVGSTLDGDRLRQVMRQAQQLPDTMVAAHIDSGQYEEQVDLHESRGLCEQLRA